MGDRRSFELRVHIVDLHHHLPLERLPAPAASPCPRACLCHVSADRERSSRRWTALQEDHRRTDQRPAAAGDAIEPPTFNLREVRNRTVRAAMAATNNHIGNPPGCSASPPTR